MHPETKAFFETAKSEDPDGVTRNEGRTVRFLVAHIASAFEELSRHVEGVESGELVHRTKTFEEREEPFLQLDWHELLDSFEPAYYRFSEVYERVLSRDPDQELRWTNRVVRLDGFQKHVRNESALHRWDIVGDDDLSMELLSNHSLTKHTIDFLGAIPMQARGIAMGAGSGSPILERLRTPGRPDILVGRNKEKQVLGFADPTGDALLEGDAAARHLFLWGRAGVPSGRLRCNGSYRQLRAVRRLLGGY